jgi:O-antigen/teichoic acid export membrane protein
MFHNLNSTFDKTILNGTAWLIIGQIISKLSVLIGAIVVARIIGREIYGEFAILKSTINTFTSISSAAFGIAATKYIAEYRVTDISKIGRIISLTTTIVLVFASAFTILIIVFSSQLSISLLDNNQLEYGLKISAIILLFSSINGLQQGIWMGFEEFKIISLVNVFSGLISIVAQTVGAYYFGLKGALFGYGSLFVLQFIINQYLLKKLYNQNVIKITLNSMMDEISIVWKFILPTMLSGIIVMPIVWICNTFLVNQNGGYSEMASFDVSLQWQALVIFIPSNISKVILPFISKIRGQNKSYKNHMKLFISLTFILTLCLSIIISFSAKYIYEFYGDDFASSSSVLIIMCAAGVFMSLNSVIGQVITTENKMWSGFLFNVIWAISLLITSYFLIQHYESAVGLALAYLFSYIILFVIQRIFYYKLSLR